ncbi:MAG: peptidyl-prolyl cis-trans isomerase [Actinomycetota bacterium]|nr:peptidyl-prolyl cis-trans isomerase [Actinomycetota bacterium]
MKLLKYILALCASVALAATLSACGSGLPGDSVADVAGNPITTKALYHQMYVESVQMVAQSPGAPVITPIDPPGFANCVAQVRKVIPMDAKAPTARIKAACARVFTALSSQALDLLIKGYWYQLDAAAAHITVSNAQVQKMFETEKKQSFKSEAQFQSFLAQSGTTEQDILFGIRASQLYEKLIAKHTTSVTSAQIKSYYSIHRSQFGSAEKRDIRIVLTKTGAQAQAAKAALAKGKSWSAVTKQYSTDATTKNKGGLLAGVVKGSEDPALDKAAFSAPLNKLLGPVHGQFGFYVFDVTKVTPATQQTLAEATPKIKSELTGQQQSAAVAAVENAARKRWQHKTTCRAAYSMMDCNGYKPPPPSRAPTTTAPTQAPPPPASTQPVPQAPPASTPKKKP